MTDPISNIGQVGGITPPSSTPSTNQVGTPDQNTVNALQNELNGADPTAPTANSTPAAGAGGISAADMDLFMKEVQKFCVQQGIMSTPKATRD